MFIFNKNTRPERIIEISQRYGLNSNDVLDNILLARYIDIYIDIIIIIII